MSLLDTLNKEQKEAVLHKNGALLLLAGAGSGKTKVITHRIAYLIQEGVSPFNILAITFTNKAAKEMKDRVNRICEQGQSVWISTFHSACVRILRADIDKLGYGNNFTIYDSDDCEKLVKRCIRELNLNDKLYQPKPIINLISSWKDELKRSKTVVNEVQGDFRLSQTAKIYEMYEKILLKSNALDFDDIIFRCVELFNLYEDVLEKYQNRFKYIMVDEYQDTNNSQYQFVKLLSMKYKNICVVGDDDQSIYGWRGANIQNILDFEKDYKDTKVIKLEQNYRSKQTILEAANNVISNNTGRKDKKLWTNQGEGSKIKYYKSKDELEEAKFISDKILENNKNNMSFKDHAILYRNNAQSRAIEDQLVKRNIPYRLLGGVRFYERREIKDLLAYLKFINNQKDESSLLRIINTPKRGIGEGTVEKVSEYSNANEITFFDALSKLEFIDGLGNRIKKLEKFTELIVNLIEFSKENTVVNLINEILKQTNYIEELQNENLEESTVRIENIEELIAKAREFENNSDVKTLALFLEEVALVADIDGYVEGEEYVVLMTLHSSKGLEFPCVFLAGFEEGIFPSFRALTSGSLKDLEEERRLCYVGITRAKEMLFLTCASARMQHGQVVYNAVSRFLKEIHNNLIEELSMDISSRNISFKDTKSAYNLSSKNILGFGDKGKLYLNNNVTISPDNVEIDFKEGDNVRQMRYGVGKVLEIRPAGADYEVTVEFENVGKKKFMAHLSKLQKVEV